MAREDSDDFVPMLFRGLIALFVFVCLAIFAGVVLFVLLPGALLLSAGLGWHAFLGVIALIFFVWLFFWFFRMVFRGAHGHHRHGWYADERDIARRRYARGEITRKEYLAIIKDLDSTK